MRLFQFQEGFKFLKKAFELQFKNQKIEMLSLKRQLLVLTMEFKTKSCRGRT